MGVKNGLVSDVFLSQNLDGNAGLRTFAKPINDEISVAAQVHT